MGRACSGSSRAVTATDERFTPPDVIALRDCVWRGGTDTDPAWSPRSFSRARRCYTKRENGLRQIWHGRVWLNPPWSNVMPWLVRLLEHMRNGPSCEQREGMLCVRNDPPTAWFKLAAKHAQAVVLMGKRTRYWQWNPKRRRVEEGGSPEFSSVIFYFGHDADAFIEVFRAAGHIAVRLHDRFTSGTLPRMAAAKKAAPQSKLEKVVREHVRAAICEHVRANPEITLGALVSGLGPGNEVALMSLRVRDLVGDISAPRKYPPTNGHVHAKPKTNGRAKSSARKPKPRSSSPSNVDPVRSQMRDDQVRKAIAKLGKAEFSSTDVMNATGISRQTAIRVLERLPEVTRTGSYRSSKYHWNQVKA